MISTINNHKKLGKNLLQQCFEIQRNINFKSELNENSVNILKFQNSFLD